MGEGVRKKKRKKTKVTLSGIDKERRELSVTP